LCYGNIYLCYGNIYSCLIGIDFVYVFTIVLLDIESIATMWYFLFFHFIFINDKVKHKQLIVT